MFRIEGHKYMRADSANRVALYIGGDVHSNRVAFSREDIALEVAELEVGESATFRRTGWAGDTRTGPVVVTNVGQAGDNGWIA